MSIFDFLDIGGDDEGSDNHKRRRPGAYVHRHDDDDDRDYKRGSRFEHDDDEGFVFGRGESRSGKRHGGKKDSPLDSIMDIFG